MATNRVEARLFLSHNAADKEYARKLAAALTVAGGRVWFDEWEIRPGDSIPSAINEALASFHTFVLLWSKAASESRWVRTEMEGAVARWIADDSVRLVPVLLDKTPIPMILRQIRYVDAIDGEHLRVARELLGFDSGASFRQAVQQFIDEAGLDFREFYGVGVLVTCPHCGALPSELEGWEQTDCLRDDHYVGVRCKACGWSDGSES